jgi:hypothetical protein
MKAKNKKKTGSNAGQPKLQAFKEAALNLVEATAIQLADFQESIDLVARELKRLSDGRH